MACPEAKCGVDEHCKEYENETGRGASVAAHLERQARPCERPSRQQYRLYHKYTGEHLCHRVDRGEE